MPILSEMMYDGRLVYGENRRWPHIEVQEADWQQIAAELTVDPFTLVALWGEMDAVHMAVRGAGNDTIIVHLRCPGRVFPSVGRVHPPAIRLERTIHDLSGLIPEGAPDERPWLDHGRWGVAHPLGIPAPAGPHPPYAFLPVEGESLHQIPVGPVHAGIIEPGHFRFTANGETVVRLEEHLGYVHKGIEALMAGADLARAAKLAGRISGDSAVAYALAFARAAEAALFIEVPPRAHGLRGLMAELERIANHFGDIGAICNDASFSMMHAHCGVLRERVLRAADACFGHRLMRDCIVPGGVATNAQSEAFAALPALMADLRRQFADLVRLYDNTASLQDRTVTTGVLTLALARQFGAGGYVGRASGAAFDARRVFTYPPYNTLTFDVPVLQEGDVNARVWIRIREVEQSLSLIEQLVEQIPDGPILADVRPGAGEGATMVEGFRGDIFVWLRLDSSGNVVRCHLRDPSWFHWPLLEAVIEGNIVADFPLCNKSFNCSYSGHDL